jgi:hypothetical protein
VVPLDALNVRIASQIELSLFAYATSVRLPSEPVYTATRGRRLLPSAVSVTQTSRLSISLGAVHSYHTDAPP